MNLSLKAKKTVLKLKNFVYMDLFKAKILVNMISNKDHTIMDNFLGNVKETKENFEIPIELGELGVNGSHSIRFVERHLRDLKTIMEN